MSLNKKIIIIILTLATILTSVAIGYSIGVDNGIPPVNTSPVNVNPAMKPVPAISAISEDLKPQFVFYEDLVCLEFGTNEFDCWNQSLNMQHRVVIEKTNKVCIYTEDRLDLMCYNKYAQIDPNDPSNQE